MIPNGRIVVDIGEQRKRTLKSELGLRGLTLREFLCAIIDKFLKDEAKND